MLANIIILVSVYGIIMLSFSVLDMIIKPTLATHELFTLFANQILFETREKEDWITGEAREGGGYKKTYVKK